MVQIICTYICETHRICKCILPLTGEGGCAREGCGWLRNYLFNWVRWSCFHRLRKCAGDLKGNCSVQAEQDLGLWGKYDSFAWFSGDAYFRLQWAQLVVCRSEYQLRINFMCRQFVREIYDGQIFIKLKNGMHFPGLDLWVRFNTDLFLLLFGAFECYWWAFLTVILVNSGRLSLICMYREQVILM